MNQQMHTTISQIITLLHVSTPSCHPQEARSQYLLIYNKHSNAFWVIKLKISQMSFDEFGHISLEIGRSSFNKEHFNKNYQMIVNFFVRCSK